MKVKCDKNILQKYVQEAASIVPSKSVNTIIENILIESIDNGVEIKATDLEVSMKAKIPATVIEKGGMVIPAGRFYEILKQLPEGDIEISSDEKTSTRINPVSPSTKAEFNIHSIPTGEFPVIKDPPESSDFEIKNSDIKQLISETIFATSNETVRYALSGVLCSLEENKIKMVATDGKRLAVSEKAVKTKAGSKKQVIIPQKSLLALSKILPDSGETMVSISENIFFNTTTMFLSTRAIDGEFPNYEPVIPKTQNKKLVTGTKKLLQAIKSVSTLAGDKYYQMKFNMNKKESILHFVNPEVGNANFTLVGASYTGDELEIGFNYQYVIDALNVIQSDETEIEFSTSETAATIKSTSNPNFLYVVMPIKIT